jgi:hypothetical protein
MERHGSDLSEPGFISRSGKPYKLVVVPSHGLPIFVCPAFGLSFLEDPYYLFFGESCPMHE